MATKVPRTPDVDKPNLSLKVKLDDMITIQPKTEKQKDFFDATTQVIISWLCMESLEQVKHTSPSIKLWKRY